MVGLRTVILFCRIVCDEQFSSVYFVFGRSKGGINPQDIEHVNI